MKKKLIIIGVLLIISTITLTGCINNASDNENAQITHPEKFIGTWSRVDPPLGVEFNFTLYSNGTCNGTPTHDFTGTWGESNDLLIINADVQGEMWTYEYSYVFSNNTETITFNPLDFPTITELIFNKQIT